MSKIYGGNAKKILTKFGEMWKVSQSRKELENLLKYMNDNDTEWVNLDIKEKKEIVEGKATHYLEVYQREAIQLANNPTEKRIVENDKLPF
jgi:predicted hydrocarbon binding protein